MKIGLVSTFNVECGISTYMDSLDELYNNCTCVLCPSDAEGFGIIGLEALARGIPLISTKTGNDYLDDGISYVHIDLPASAEKIYNALVCLYNNWQYYREAALYQRDLILNKYDWDKIIGGILL